MSQWPSSVSLTRLLRASWMGRFAGQRSLAFDDSSCGDSPSLSSIVYWSRKSKCLPWLMPAGSLGTGSHGSAGNLTPRCTSRRSAPQVIVAR